MYVAYIIAILVFQQCNIKQQMYSIVFIKIDSIMVFITPFAIQALGI